MTRSTPILAVAAVLVALSPPQVRAEKLLVTTKLASGHGAGGVPSVNALGHVVWKRASPVELWFYDGATATKLTLPSGVSNIDVPHLAKNADFAAYFNSAAGGTCYLHNAATDIATNVTALAGHANSWSANIANDGLAIFNDNAGTKPLYVSDGVSATLVTGTNKGNHGFYHPVSEPSSNGFTYTSTTDGGANWNLYLYSGGMSGTSTLIGNSGAASAEGNNPQQYQYSDDGSYLAMYKFGDIRYIDISSGTIEHTFNEGGNE